MSKRPKVPNVALRRVRVEEFQQTRAEFADALMRTSLELGDGLEPSERYIARLEDGDISYPHPACRRALVELCGRPITELGFTVRVPPVAERELMPARLDADVVPVVLASHAPGTARQIADSKWPTWFGVKLARLIALVDGWRCHNADIGSLQAILAQEISMLNLSAPATGDSGHAAYVQSRRTVLTTLAALPVAFATTSALPEDGSSIAAVRESFLTQCAASLTACWHLLRGSDLLVIDEMLETYLVPLEGIAHQRSKHQQIAATLASQAHRIRGIVALHHDQIGVREHHCKQAVHYATVAADVSGQVSALISLASTYFYSSDPKRAAATYERALTLESQTPPLQRSRLYAELSVVYGQLSREQDALSFARRAEDIYPGDPENDPSYLYAEFTPASLALEQGLAHIALAEHYSGHGYQRQAADMLGRIDQVTALIVPDRIRYEIMNHQARAAVLLDDMEAFEFYIDRGIDGAVILGSKQREREARQAWQLAADKWPNERCIQAVTERLQLTASDSSGDSA